ncbi:hypothetical protein H6F74_08185 [Trichocoleus sp. FACHB-90]|uniref:hypothetical protein n=1 Tax=Cyanophyceae TaxID=3028117 RepID=UPI00168400A5|nr:hypothetical protein [Trichocoleus sp. FACHB-90]MBD1926228.1 hypothetical protein [Trichocoleus sp. FACHB-90]
MSSALPPLKASEVAGKMALLDWHVTGGEQNAIAAPIYGKYPKASLRSLRYATVHSKI